LGAPLREFGWESSLPLAGLPGIVGQQHRRSVRVENGQRPYDKALDQGEDRGIHADAEAQSNDRQRPQPRLAGEHAGAVAEILKKGVHGYWITSNLPAKLSASISRTWGRSLGALCPPPGQCCPLLGRASGVGQSPAGGCGQPPPQHPG
jgi:hypothetical protein